jgi:uncharacterized protein YndB with AHSA1/START domain
MSAAENKQMAESDNDLVIARIIDAPRKLVFEAWTKPEHLMRWFAPQGCSTPFCTVDLRVGGKFHFCMRMPNGLEIWGLGVYKEIVEPERIVYIDTFADVAGNVVPPSHYGMSASYPEETVVTLTFFERDGKTKLTLRHTVPGSFAERDEMQQGWSQMLDHLTEDLANAIKGKTS